MVTRIGRFIGLGLGLWLIWFTPALGQENKEPQEKPWSGRLADGQVITVADLDQILQEHKLGLLVWVAKNNGKKPT